MVMFDPLTSHLHESHAHGWREGARALGARSWGSARGRCARGSGRVGGIGGLNEVAPTVKTLKLDRQKDAMMIM